MNDQYIRLKTSEHKKKKTSIIPTLNVNPETPLTFTNHLTTSHENVKGEK